MSFGCNSQEFFMNIQIFTIVSLTICLTQSFKWTNTFLKTKYYTRVSNLARYCVRLLPANSINPASVNIFRHVIILLNMACIYQSNSSSSSHYISYIHQCYTLHMTNNTRKAQKTNSMHVKCLIFYLYYMLTHSKIYL